MSAAVATHLAPGGTFAAALLDDEALSGQTSRPSPLPDVREIDGWVYSSLPVEVADVRGGHRDPPAAPGCLPRRRAATSAPSRSASTRSDAGELEIEAAMHRLVPRERIPVPATADHVGSIVVRAGGGLMKLRVLALYPEQMNIYADRGNMLFLQPPLRVARDRLRADRRRARRELRPRRPRPPLHRRRPGPRPAARRRRHARDQARRDRRGRRRRRRRCSPSAAAISCSATATSSAKSGSRASGWSTSRPSATDGPRLIGNVAIEADLGDGRALEIAGFENHGGRTHLGAGVEPLGRVIRGHGNNGKRRLRGRPRRATSSAPTSTAPCCRRTPELADHLIALALARAVPARAARARAAATTALEARRASTRVARLDGVGRATPAQRPDEPKPPSPRSLSPSSSASTGSARGERRRSRAGRCGRPTATSNGSAGPC